MSVAAVPVNFGTETASGSVVFDSRGGALGWHVHHRHQIAGARGDAIDVETAAQHHVVIVGQAVLIPAGVVHRTTVPAGAQSLSVFLDRDALPGLDGEVRRLAMTPLLRELIGYSDRWPLARREETDTDGAFFRTLAHVVADALAEDRPIVLPSSMSPGVAAAMAFTREHLRASAAEVAGAVGMSERTMRRAFESVGVSWRAYQSLARMQRARDLLAQEAVSVLDVALRVGFESASAFARAFTATCGESPASYRRRVSARCRGA